MAIEKVRDYFRAFGMEDRIREMDMSSATVELAAKAVGTEPARIAKTLSFKDEDGCILVVTAGDMKIDNSKFKKQFHMKAKMLTPEEVNAYTGHAIGGVCPFAVGDAVKVYTDISLQRFETVFPAAGSSNSAIELSCEELFKYSNSLGWIDVSRSILNS
ncbi:MAG TPA: YbaK/EbsC family protein [Candidatus Scybalocola faecigallinarum]|uniref:YbaK/EbsC family protein n=1 Tax=Candidatus Scybalocola faecigallinarum TaxID=2840941 RepID=A0A9D1F3C6_9FIRM|nr:YbaK/EbsC family protein [Candidatus Scybalocola faecigallinarum]